MKNISKQKLVLKIILLLAVLNTAYLSWRFIALENEIVSQGTGICSITEFVDCDKVLSTPEARAFFVPNAILGFGFFFGCLLWIFFGEKLGETYQHHIYRTLAFWLAVATLFTFRFWWLLLHLDAFCPLCPWNHILTYFALIFSILIWLKTPKPTQKLPAKPLILLVALCVSQFFLWLFLWFINF